MTKAETLDLLQRIQAGYPSFRIDNAAATAEIWYANIGDLDYKAVLAALYRYIQTNTTPFAPAISVLRGYVASIEVGDLDKDEAEAWELVMDAVRRSVYYSVEEYGKLPDIVKHSVRSAEQLRQWALMDSEVFHSVGRGQFTKTYREIRRRAQEESRMSPGMRRYVQEATARIEAQRQAMLAKQEAPEIEAKPDPEVPVNTKPEGYYTAELRRRLGA